MSDRHVIFGTGPLGKGTARELVKMGHSVRMINRSGKADNLPKEVEVVAGDAYDTARNIALCQGAAVIYQCAQPHYYEWAEKFPAMQRAIMDTAVAQNAKFIVGDNLYMYGHFQGALREDSPIAPNTRKGWVRAAMAQEVLAAHANGQLQAAIGRASDFFGPEDTALTTFAIQPAIEGKPINLLGRTDQPHTFTYIPDFGRLLATLGTREEALGQVWFTPSNAPLTQAEFADLLAAELGQPVKTRVAGALMMRFLGLFNKEMAETVEMMFEWNHPYIVDSTKAQNAFDLRPTPLREALRETLAWLREPSMTVLA